MEKQSLGGRAATIESVFDTTDKESVISHPDCPFVKQVRKRVVPGVNKGMNGLGIMRFLISRPLALLGIFLRYRPVFMRNKRPA